jgi:hypothetical protein
MYARLISMSDATAESRERAIQAIRERVIPTLRQHDGYAGYVGLFDLDNRRAKAVLFWESREAAEASEKELAAFRVELITGLGMSIESVDLYEAVAVEME